MGYLEYCIYKYTTFKPQFTCCVMENIDFSVHNGLYEHLMSDLIIKKVVI